MGTGDENNNDLLADLLDEEIAAAEENGGSNTELEALKSQVEELKNANAGLLKAKQSETKRRQSEQERISQMEGAINTILSQRQQQGMASLTEAEAAEATAKGLPVEYDDDGNGWVNPADIQSMINPVLTQYQQKINDLENRLQQTSAASNARSEADRIMEGIIGEDERFGPASGRYRAARRWVENVAADFARSNNVGRNLTSGEVLDYALDDMTKKAFADQFPNVDIVDVVTAEDSQEHFRRTMRNIASTLDTSDSLNKPKDKMDSRFQKVLNKPSTLGNQANAKAGQLSILDKVGNLSTSDILDLSDEQVETLMKLAGKEGI